MKTSTLAAATLVAALAIPGPVRAGNIAAEACRKDPNPECLLAWAADPQLINAISDKEFRAYALKAIADAQAYFGDEDSARATQARALEVMPELRRAPWRDTELFFKAYDAAVAADYTLAFELSDSIEEPSLRYEALAQIAYAQAGAGDFDGALAIARRVGASEVMDRGMRILALTMIARIQSDAGAQSGAIETVTEALDLADREQDQRMRDHYRRNIALVCADIGATGLVLKLANLLESEEDVVRVLHRTAVAQAKAGDLSAARKTFQQISSPTWRAYAIAQTAEVVSIAGDSRAGNDLFTEALRVARGIPSDATSELDSRSTALTRVAGSLVRAGRPDEALRVATEITNPEERGPLKIAVVKALVESENTQAALAAARDIELARRRAEALSEIAVALSEAGDKAGARAIFTDAIEAAGDQHDFDVAQTLISIAAMQASTGLAKDAAATALSIKLVHQRTSALANVTGKLSRRGDVDEALALLEHAEGAYEKVNLLVSAASGMMEREQ